MNLYSLYHNCGLCPRDCRVDRCATGAKIRLGLCGERSRPRVAHVGAHFGEEPPISGTNGSGTVFFSGCSLKCSFCQNHQISHQGLGQELGEEELFEKVKRMVRCHRVHNINFVTPDHFFPHVFELVQSLRLQNVSLPIVYNLSGYQSLELLRVAEDYVDIYLPDFKYSDRSTAKDLSRCENYPSVALGAVSEMIRQKGFLDADPGDERLARRGVLVRHLILPGRVANSLDALTILFIEFGDRLPLSLMSQFHPTLPQESAELDRSISREEFTRVYTHAMELGFEQLFVQFPDPQDDTLPVPSRFFPDFQKVNPFG